MHMSNSLGLQDTQQTEGYGLEPNRDELEMRLKNGANWVYWIAGLSVINSLIYISGSDVSFLAGLGFTQLVAAFVDIAIESGAPAAMRGVSIVFSLVVVVVFGLFGYYANKRFTAAFVVGIILYFLDGLLLLLLGVFFSAGFHAFALIFIVRGFLACRELNAFDAARAFQHPPPPPPAAL